MDTSFNTDPSQDFGADPYYQQMLRDMEAQRQKQQQQQQGGQGSGQGIQSLLKMLQSDDSGGGGGTSYSGDFSGGYGSFSGGFA